MALEQLGGDIDVVIDSHETTQINTCGWTFVPCNGNFIYSLLFYI